MAVESDPDVTTPKSTGAVKFTADPVTTEQVTDNEKSTDAVKYDAPGETTVDYHGADAVVRQETPSEPVTMTVSWKSDTEQKVVTPSEDDTEAPKTTDKAETKS